MRLFLPLIVCVLLASCENDKTDYQKLIQGNWECIHLNKSGDTNMINLSFKGSFCYFDWCRSETNRYSINENKITIKTDCVWPNKHKIQHLRIVGFSNGIMKIVSDDSWLNHNYDIQPSDTLYFKPLKAKNHIKKASVALTVVGGDMPYNFQIEILQDRTAKLKTHDVIGFKTGYCYSGRLKKSTYHLLLDELNNIDFDNWKEDYSGCCDGGSNYLLFKLDGKKYKLYVYSDWDKPSGIQKLIAFLQANTRNIDWKSERSKDCPFYYSKEMNVLVYGQPEGQIEKVLQFIPLTK